jgi:hypothetical protein
MSHKILAALALLVCVLAVAQKSDDADKQKLSDIEQKFTTTSGFQTPEMTALLQKYLYDGATSVVVLSGHLFHAAKKADVIAATKPDPNDPNAKSTIKLSDLQADIYDDTALVSYKQVTIESGHKDPALNGEYITTNLDTFVKRKGEWYLIGASSVPAVPVMQAHWDAWKKMSEQLDKPPSQ